MEKNILNIEIGDIVLPLKTSGKRLTYMKYYEVIYVEKIEVDCPIETYEKPISFTIIDDTGNKRKYKINERRFMVRGKSF